MPSRRWRELEPWLGAGVSPPPEAWLAEPAVRKSINAQTHTHRHYWSRYSRTDSQTVPHIQAFTPFPRTQVSVEPCVREDEEKNTKRTRHRRASQSPGVGSSHCHVVRHVRHRRRPLHAVLRRGRRARGSHAAAVTNSGPGLGSAGQWHHRLPRSRRRGTSGRRAAQRSRGCGGGRHRRRRRARAAVCCCGCHYRVNGHEYRTQPKKTKASSAQGGRRGGGHAGVHASTTRQTHRHAWSQTQRRKSNTNMCRGSDDGDTAQWDRTGVVTCPWHVASPPKKKISKMYHSRTPRKAALEGPDALPPPTAITTKR